MKTRKTNTLSKILLAGALAFGGVNALNAEEAKTPKKSDSIFLEETLATQDNQNTMYHFAGLFNENRPYAKILFTDNEDPSADSISYGARGSFDLFGMEGVAEMIGFNTRDDYGYGVNARGDVNDFLKIGTALEKSLVGGDTTRLGMAYTTFNLDDFKVNLGLSNTDVEGDRTGRGTATLSYTQGQNMYGFGVTSDTFGFDKDAQGFATAMAGRFGKQEGDIGYRAWIKSDFEGNYMIDLLFSTNTAISAPSIGCVTEPDNGFHDQKLFANRFDAAPYLFERAKQGGFVIHGNHSKSNDTVTNFVEGLYKFHKKGSIAPMAGLGFSTTDDGTDVTDSLYGMFGAELDKGYVQLKITGTEGQKPSFQAVAGYGF